MSTEREKFFVDTPFTKTADTPRGDLKLAGYASTWTLDRDQEVVDPKAFDQSLMRYKSENPILLWQHNMEQPIGVIEEAEVDAYGLRVKAHVPKPAEREPDWAHLAYNKIKSGVVKTFSIGGGFEKEVRKGIKVISGIDLFEISVVSVPANPDSIFAAAVKAVRDEHRPELNATQVNQMAQLLGVKVLSDPELAAMAEDERVERYVELSKAYRAVGHMPPSLNAWRDIEESLPPLERLNRIKGVLELVNMRVPLVDVKAGRVFSRENETRLRELGKIVNEMLAVMESAPEVEREVSSPADELNREKD